MIRVKNTGNFEKTLTFFERILNFNYLSILNEYGKKGVSALIAYTPKDSGETASSWTYSITKKNGSLLLSWNNSVLTEEGTPIAILIQYGHATKNGGFLIGQDFINPALKPVFEQMTNELWGRLTNG